MFVDQKTTYTSQFFPFCVWAFEIKLKLSVLVAVTFTQRDIFPVLPSFYNNPNRRP